jgi:tetratricopeptide (TPR) repeat protein
LDTAGQDQGKEGYAHAMNKTGGRGLAKRRGSRQANSVPAAATPARPASHAWIAGFVLVAGTGLLFSRSLGYGFINYDDPIYLADNEQVRAGLTWHGLAWAFAGRSDYWHPLTWLSHMLDWQLFGANATGHRLVNVAWHAANAVLVFALFRRLALGWWGALFGAALFAWHPLRVESVVWVTERKDVMSGCFFLLTAWSYLGYLSARRDARSAAGAYARTLAFFLGGLMCKPSLVTAPLVLLALDFWPGGRLTDRRELTRALLGKIPFLLLAGAVAAATIRMQYQAGAFVLELTPSDRAGNALVSVVRYLGKFFWPADLVICYPHPGTWPLLLVLGAAALLAGLTFVAWRQRGPRPWLLAGWVWYLALLLPMLGLWQVGPQAMADRFTYLAILGWQLALLATWQAWPVPPAVSRGVAGLTLAAAATLTWHQQAYWRDSATLYRHALAVDERNTFVRGFLAFTELQDGRLAEAETQARRTLAVAPKNQSAWLALAGAQRQLGQAAEAAESYRRLLELEPANLPARVARVALLAQTGQLAAASAEQAHAVALDPQEPRLRESLAALLARQRRFAEAAAAYEGWLALEPDNAQAHAGLGYMLALLGRTDEAAAHWREALRLRPDFPGLRERLERLHR